MSVSVWFISASSYTHINIYHSNKIYIKKHKYITVCAVNVYTLGWYTESILQNKSLTHQKYLGITWNEMLSAVGDESVVCEHSHREVDEGEGVP